MNNSSHTIDPEFADTIYASKMLAITELAAGITHEINNPLTVIHGRIFQLQQLNESKNFDPQKIDVIIESVLKAADRIQSTLSHMRSIARDSSQDSFELVPLHQIITHTLAVLQSRFTSYGISIELSEFDKDLEIECRKSQIQQALLAILNNAFDAVSAPEVKLKKVTVAVDQLLPDKIQITINDSGNGIASELRELIWQPFFTTKVTHKGAGLGLHVAKSLINSHQGTMKLADSNTHSPSSAMTGATFCITLPLFQQK